MTYFLKLLAHVALAFIAFILAYDLRRGLPLEWWVTNPQAAAVLSWACVYAAITAFYEIIYRTERTAWRYSSFPDVVRLVQSTGLTALTFLALIFVSSRAISLPRSTLVLSWLLSLFALVGVRLLWRLSTDSRAFSALLPMAARRKGPGLILVGDVSRAEAYLRHHQAHPETDYQPVSIVADRPGLVGQLVLGVPVVGVANDLEAILAANRRRTDAPKALLFLQDKLADFPFPAELIGRLRAEGYTMLRQRSVVELSRGETDTPLKEISLEEFLPREPVLLDPAPIADRIRGKRVLVTGAGGSIGSEICRQLVAFGCSHIALLDHSEFLLFEIDRALGQLQTAGGRRAHLCNVRDGERVLQIMKEERPDIVFHAAALKHVTLVENNISEGVLTNVVGTHNVAQAAKAVGAEQMVLISTDKAVNPTSMMGATKRIAESVLLAPSGDGPLYCTVRFGNVLGSAGSVVPIFKDQISRGGPVTVTHPDVERYFMTIPEAVQLVLHATALAASQKRDHKRTFILEMGEPVRIMDLATRMIELSGMKAGADIEIAITGLKPGEKLTEELVDIGEESAPCTHGIAEIVPMVNGRAGAVNVNRLKRMAEAGDDTGLRAEIEALLQQLRLGAGRAVGKSVA